MSASITTVEVGDPHQAGRLVWEHLAPQRRGLLNERDACSREFEAFDHRGFASQPEDYRSRFSFAALDAMRVSRIADDRATQVTVRTPGLDAYCIALMERGACKLLPAGANEALVGDTDTCPISDGERGMRLISTDSSIRFILWASGRLLREKLELLLDGREQVKSLAFHPAFNQAHGPGATIRGMLQFLFTELSRFDSLLANELALRSFENNLALCLLLGLSHTHSERLRQPSVCATPGNMRRAEQFMRANACMPLTIAEIAQAAECSVRALQMAFRRFGNTTPMAALRQVRLDEARAEMLRAGRTESLTRIAADHGFSNPSRFAQLFRRKYGVYPSQAARIESKKPAGTVLHASRGGQQESARTGWTWPSDSHNYACR